jgi:uncharacterized protein
MMEFEITPLDHPNTLLEINNAAVPDIGVLNPVKAQWLVEHLMMPGLVLLDGQTAGIIVVLNEHCGYDSDYYRWFTDRYENFLYIDRIVVAAWARGKGVAKQIYQMVEQTAQEYELAIVADVYSEPPNVPSLKFHEAMGYKIIGTAYMADQKKTVAKFMKYSERAKRKHTT